MGLFTKLFGSYSDRELKRILPIAKSVEEKEEDRSLPLALAFGENYSALAAMT